MKTLLIIILFFTGALLSELNLMLKEAQLQFVSIFLVVLVDLAFGVARAIKYKVFEVSKAFKSVFMLVAFWGLLYTVLTIEKGFSYVDWLSEAIVLPILIFQLISILKNMQILGLISNELLGKILSSIDKHKEKNVNDIPVEEYEEIQVNETENLKR
ncbi:conserved membrane hypothetical protein [Tenacibaculum sp. 190524A02b]|uniref:Holin n=1 Tax=Tenacibaculum vairaonense TaxID=3137860 RepID=A0ABM9PL24_9FLAO